MQKNLIILAILVVGIISGLFLWSPLSIYKNEAINDQASIPKVGGVDFNEPLEINKAVESVYVNSANLPRHHTLCVPTKKYICNLNGCEETPAEVFSLIGGTRNTPTLSRCDRNPCDTYDAYLDDSGSYKNVQLETPSGMFLKMSYNTIDKKYVEVATLGLDTFITYGYCLYDIDLKARGLI